MGGHNCSRCGVEIPEGNRFCNACGHQLRPAAAGGDDPLLGRYLAQKYRVEMLLGSGGMGCVYLAEHVALNRRVALKVLNPALASNESLVQRFLREARAASRLLHPNIVTLLDFGQEPDDGLLYLVMEYLEGRSLHAVLQQDGPMLLSRVLRLGRQILLATDEAHVQGVVHRDLKPENVIVLPHRQGEELIKVVDFGLAQVLGGQDPKLTSTGLICGTPAYISPEQARSSDVGPASDIYSFGVMLYEMCTGQLPFDAESPYVLVSKHLTEKPMHPAQRAPERDIPELLASVILRCLEKEPEQRFASAMEAHDALVAAIGRRPSAETPIISSPSQELAIAAAADLVEERRGRPAPRAEPKPITGPHRRMSSVGVSEVVVCAACGAEMPAGAKFCGGCGGALGARCSCGNSCRPGQRFCSACGMVLASGAPTRLTPRSTASVDPGLEQLRKQAPAAVVEAFVRADPALAVQRREVTVLFADLSGFGDRVVDGDAEELFEVMSGCFDALAASALRFGGTVDKLISDCVMAVFGAPTAHEDDPERALRAAFAMTTAVAEHSRRLPFPLALRVGIHSGPVVAGAAAAAQLSYTLIGEAVNVAQQLTTAAEAGQILISERIHEVCHALGTFKPLPPLQLRSAGAGSARRLPVYEAQHLSGAAVQPALSTAFIGRAREREVIEEAGRQALARHGSTVVISGEPGIGKSALLQHAAELLRRIGLRVHLGRAQPYQLGPSALGQLLRSLVGCRSDARDAEVQASLAAIGSQGLDDADHEALRQLMFAADGQHHLTPEALDTACATAVRRLLRQRAATEPTALLLDDVRHLPSRERGLLAVAAGAARDAALLLVIADRGRLLDGAQHVELGPLPNIDAQRLLQRLVGDRPVHAELSHRLLQAAGGNPLYLIETTRLLDERGQLELRTPRDRPASSLQIPDGIRGVVTARFDALDGAVRNVLIYAAVIGRGFDVELLGRLLRDGQIAPTLARLCELGILEPEEESDSRPRLRFRHEVVREVLCELVTHKARRTIHDAVATLLLTDGQQVPLEEIAAHLEQAGRDGEAADFFERAADQRLAQGDDPEAAVSLGRALAALERAQVNGVAGRGGGGPRAIKLRIKVARALNNVSRWEEAKAAALAARNAAQQVGDPLLAARAAQQLARASAEVGALPVAESLLAEASQAALECGDLELAAELASDLGEARERSGDLPHALSTLLGAFDRLESALRHARGPQAAAAGARVAEVLNRLGRVAFRARRVDEALGYLTSALEQAQALGDHALEARVLGNLGNALAARGDTSRACTTLNQALQTTQRLGDRLATAKLLHNLAQLHFSTGKRDQAQALARESFDLSVEIGWREGEALSAAFLQQIAKPQQPRS